MEKDNRMHSDMNSFQTDQQNQMHPLSEPCIVSGPVQNFPQHVVAPPGNAANPNMRQRPDRFDGGFYGFMPYNGIPPHFAAPVHGLAIAATPHYYNFPVMPPPSALVPIPQNYGPLDPLSSANSHRFVGLPMDEHARNMHLMEHLRGSNKRKVPEGIPGSVHAITPSGGSASLIGPSNPMPSDGHVRMHALYPAPQLPRANGAPVTEHENVSSGSVAVSMDPTRVQNHNQFNRGSYISQPFPAASTGAVPLWNPITAVSYMPGANFSRAPMEVRSLSLQGYHEPSSSLNYLHPPPMNQHFHNLPHPPYPMQVVRQEFPFHPSVPGVSYRPLPNNALGNVVPQDNFGMGIWQPAAGLRTHRAQGGDAVEETTANRNLPHLRVLAVDDVAVLDTPDSGDQHRDMRLDIEDMSYEELLALGEQIGSVNTGLPEETIGKQLKTRTYQQTAAPVKMDEMACTPQEADSCTICQDTYKSNEKIGTLDCGHEYHTDCLKRWLSVKNVCPICKSEALSSKRG